MYHTFGTASSSLPPMATPDSPKRIPGQSPICKHFILYIFKVFECRQVLAAEPKFLELSPQTDLPVPFCHCLLSMGETFFLFQLSFPQQSLLSVLCFNCGFYAFVHAL